MALQKARLQAKIDKYVFQNTKISYLRLIISSKNICIDSIKVEAIWNWKNPTYVKDVQVFIGFANFYFRFIRVFSKKVRSIIATVKKNITFHWTPKSQKFFQLLKECFTTNLVLAYFNFEKEYIL